jgi:hypothetical protein
MAIDVSDPIKRQRLETANQRAAARVTREYAGRRAAAPQAITRMAIGGGQLMDASMAPGYQNPEVGQYTGLLKRGITRPAKAAERSAIALMRLRNKPWYKKAARDLVGDNAGYGAAVGGIATTPDEQPSYGIPIL